MAEKKIALVTGGGRGIGFGVASCLAEEGYNLAICGVREESQVTEALEALRKKGSDVLYCQADIGKTEPRNKMVAKINKHFGALHVLVNNAGVAPKERADILEASEESFAWVIQTNLQGPYFLTQSVANWMIEQKKNKQDIFCCIITISSISATAASVNRGDYCISKAGLAMASKLWATRLGEYTIPAYEVRPGIVKTDMTSGVIEKYDKLIAEGLLVQPRWGAPEDVGKTVAMLARGDMAYSSGSVVMVDGGFAVERL